MSDFNKMLDGLHEQIAALRAERDALAKRVFEKDQGWAKAEAERDAAVATAKAERAARFGQEANNSEACRKYVALEAERDRLRAALTEIADYCGEMQDRESGPAMHPAAKRLVDDAMHILKIAAPSTAATKPAGTDCHACGGSGEFPHGLGMETEPCDYCEGTGKELPHQTATRALNQSTGVGVGCTAGSLPIALVEIQHPRPSEATRYDTPISDTWRGPVATSFPAPSPAPHAEAVTEILRRMHYSLSSIGMMLQKHAGGSWSLRGQPQDLSAIVTEASECLRLSNAALGAAGRG